MKGNGRRITYNRLHTRKRANVTNSFTHVTVPFPTNILLWLPIQSITMNAWFSSNKAAQLIDSLSHKPTQDLILFPIVNESFLEMI